MEKLQDCYNQLQTILVDGIEPYESVELVESYRRYWKPDKVRIVLLAESHVFTTKKDRDITVSKISQLPGYPTEYAKFVYCLAYGENQLTNSDKHSKRDGTPQFWKIFYGCNNPVTSLQDFQPVLSKTPFEQRLQNKIGLLLSLKQKGIWLVDSSIVALYNNGEKPEIKTLLSVIRTSWECYTSRVIEEANPEHIICIGKDVARAIEGDIRRLVGSRYTVIAQPNARLTSEEHMENYKKYGEICGIC